MKRREEPAKQGSMTPADLPVTRILPDLLAALANGPNAVVEAPPGAGKTTLVPLALLDASWRGDGVILMLEPRRIAARASAERMASLLGERVGQRVGYRIRDEAQISPATRIEVITEGILTRRLQADPVLTGVAAVIFDEFHERSLHADLGLALCLEVQAALRPELRLLVMSATLNAAPVAALMGDCPIIRSEGRAFPVEIRWADRHWRDPLGKGPQFERAMATTIARALREESGDLLAFLPGAGEIARVASMLDVDADIRPLHGELPFADQRAAIEPGPRRRVVLATNIAETSLTIEGVRIVVDGGLVRRARFDAASGLSRLELMPIDRASAEQRRGRAGRVAPGVCYRLWPRAAEGAMAAEAAPEIAEADLCGLVLDMAQWGARDPSALPLLTPPPPAAWESAVALLRLLGALDADGAITPHGRALAALPLHPRLGQMLLADRSGAAVLMAATLEGRDPLRGSGADLMTRLSAVMHPGSNPVLHRLRENARLLARRLGHAEPRLPDAETAATLLAAGWPDRIAKRREGDAPRYLMANGRGASAEPGDPLGYSPFLVIAEAAGDAQAAHIRLALPISRTALEGQFAARLERVTVVEFDPVKGELLARKRLMLGALVLTEAPWPDPDSAALTAGLCTAVRHLGLHILPWTEACHQLRDRLRWAGLNPPDDVALLATLETWLGPWLVGLKRVADLARIDLLAALRAMLPHDTLAALDRLAPSHFTAPTGTRVAIDYSGDHPSVAIRMQELFGQTTHPSIREGTVPLTLVLLTPAHRPAQVTRDLPGFWRTSWADVRKDLRGRYPRHFWPEDPTQADPTTRAKPRGS